MKAGDLVMHKNIVPFLVGLALAGASTMALSQEQQQGQAQEQREGELRVAVAPNEAQPTQQQGTFSAVRVIHVKSDRVGEFEDLIKELGAAIAKRGEAGFNVWQVEFGDQSTYHIVSELQSFASLPQMEANPPMEPQRWADWLHRIQGTIDSQTVSVAQVHTDLSIMPQEPSGAEAAPELLILVSQTLLPGKRQEYTTWLRDDLLPALRKAGILGVVSNEMAFGSEDRNWVFAVPIRNWAELDKPMPLFTSMGQQAAEELLNHGDSMVGRSETVVLRARPDLSAASAQPGQQQQQQQQRSPQ
ncbi:MAG TPA: hypothetical protein VFV10_10525 [Gammaproteobacteria bacterium]|nr:hypothetical protein [Gammaproteobacteria bacterium]